MIIIPFLSACSKQKTLNDELTKGLPSSSGKTLEMIVVASDDIYNGELQDSVNHIFAKACVGLPQREPLFDVVHLRPGGFIHSDMLQKHRNILIIDKKAGNPNKIYQEINQRVFPQAVYKINVDNNDSLIAILSRFAPAMKYRFYTNEHDRIYNAFRRDANVGLNEKIKKNFGFKLTFSSDYYLATQKKDFYWIRKETENESYGIMIYRMPFKGEKLLSQEKIIDIRDEIAKENIPGPMKGSYMGTEKRVEPESKVVRINGIDMIETRGLWRLFGDFMGGAFINYCFSHPQTHEYIMIDCFLYSPKKPKRDLLMHMESIVFSINK